MAKSQETYNKKEKEKKRLKKRQDKQLKMEERKLNPTASGLDAMIAYVDEFGHITDTPPDPTVKKKKINLDSIEISVPKRGEEETPSARTGKIDFFNHQKGFGFIKENGTQDKYFVHVHGLMDEVEEGNAVTFELERGMKGMNAVRVKKI
jgi:cold shock CspA family protein